MGQKQQNQQNQQNQQDNSNFNGLVNGISPYERQVLLNRITKTEEKLDKKSSENDKSDYVENSLQEQLSRVSLLQRFIFWLRATFTGTTVEGVFNAYLLSKLASSVEHSYKLVINYKRAVLSSSYYDKLSLLHSAQDFFQEAIELYDQSPDKFYTILGRVIMPEIMDEIFKVSDPYQYPFTKELNKEMRLNLINKMEKIEDNIPQDKRIEMYNAVRSMEWLKSFVNLPFTRFLTKFSMDANGNRECLFTQCTNEVTAFSKVFCEQKPITEELLKAIETFVGSRRREKVSRDGEVSTVSFQEEAAAQISVINAFTEGIPIDSITKLVLGNAVYRAEGIAGGEDWLVKFKMHQKTVFDARWEEWIHEYKKQKIKIKLVSYFSIPEFPTFPYRPWTELWDGVVFHYELTLGFLYNFFKIVYPEYERTLKVIALEGDFSVKENRVEFTDSMNELNQMYQDLTMLASQLTGAGEFGQAFAKFKGVHTKSKSTVEKVDVLMSDVERIAFTLISNFGKTCRSMENILLGMLGEKISPYYGPLTNLSKIKGAENKEFRESLERTKNGILHAFDLVKDLEPLDKEVE